METLSIQHQLFSSHAQEHKLGQCSFFSSSYENVKNKINRIWTHFSTELSNYLRRPVEKQIEFEIAKIDRQVPLSNPLYLSALRRAFIQSNLAIKNEGLNPTKLPKQVAFQLTEILGRFGIGIYANKNVKDPFQSSLTILKIAFLMQKYALGLSSTCPDLSKTLIIDNLYEEKFSSLYSPEADLAIDSMETKQWTKKTLLLTEKQQLLIPQLLRYLNGAMGYLKQNTLARRELLLKTAEECLLEAQKKPSFNQIEVDDLLAELNYNEMTGLLAAKIEDYEAKEQLDEAKQTKEKLTHLWDECVKLSKNPEMMSARCDNKRTFIEKLSPENEILLRKRALNKHLSIPKEKQNPMLIALAHNNLSYVYKQSNEKEKALKHAKEALIYVKEAMNKGENNVQFDNVRNHARSLGITV